MSKRKFLIVTLIQNDNKSAEIRFDFQNIVSNFENTNIEDTELHYNIVDEVDTILDSKVNETIHFYEDRAKDFPCLLKRVA